MPVSLRLPFDGGKLREIRERAGLTTRDLAARCKGNGHAVSQNHIWRLETGRSTTTPPVLKVLADTLGVEIDALLTPRNDSAAAS